MSKPSTPVTSWEEWVAADGAWQMHVYETTGKRPPRLDPPNPSLFATEDMYKSALENRLVLCDKKDHVGDRLLIKDQRYGLSTCAPCKRAAKMQRAKATKPAPTVYSCADEWFKNVALDRSKEHPTIVGNCPVPIRESFTTDQEFQRAQVLRDERRRLYQHEYSKLPEIRERDNTSQRDKYHAEKKQRLDEGNQNE
tara:strand:- start:1242 stop:1829 length:588 start_codon:yes stop_codon:yes gene_type:complete